MSVAKEDKINTIKWLKWPSVGVFTRRKGNINNKYVSHLRYGVAVQDPDHHVLLELVLDYAAPHHAGSHGLPEQPVLRQGVARVVSALVHRALLNLQQNGILLGKLRGMKGLAAFLFPPSR